MKTLDECFKIIGQKPVETKGRLHEVLAEDFRRELAEIESPEGRRLFVLAKANRLTHLRIAEYEILIAAADLTGHYGVGVLLESCPGGQADVRGKDAPADPPSAGATGRRVVGPAWPANEHPAGHIRTAFGHYVRQAACARLGTLGPPGSQRALSQDTLRLGTLKRYQILQEDSERDHQKICNGRQLYIARAVEVFIHIGLVAALAAVCLLILAPFVRHHCLGHYYRRGFLSHRPEAAERSSGAQGLAAAIWTILLLAVLIVPVFCWLRVRLMAPAA